jgi:hypothetical protein
MPSELLPWSCIEIFYFFKKSFCKNIRRFENFALLTPLAVAHGGRRLYYFKKSFCKNIRRFENFAFLTFIRPWPTTVSALTAVGYAVPLTAAWSGPATAVGHDGCMWHTAVAHSG